MAKVIGVDSSTQSCKLIVRDLDSGEVISTSQAGHPDGTEVDPEKWWEALQSNLAATDLVDVEAISIGAQQHGMVLLGENGEVLRPALLWNDTRSAGEAQELIEHFGADELAKRTGSVPVASFTVTKLAWVRKNEPEIAKKVAAVALPHDWLTWRLRGFGEPGKSAHGPKLDELVTDRSDASGTCYFSPITNTYDDEILKHALGHLPILPRVANPDEVVGEMGGGIKVAAGGGDNALAALGLGAEIGDVVMSLGTSGTVFAVTSQASKDESGIVAGFADASGQYLPLIATLNAARAIDSVREFLNLSWDDFSEAVLNSQPGASGLVMAPFFDGERTPNLPNSRASIAGISRGNLNRENLARSVVEGVVANLADGLDAIVQQTEDVKRILVVGGGAQNRATISVISENFSLPITLPEAGEYVALGAATQAAWALNGSRPSWKPKGDSIPNSELLSPAREQLHSLLRHYSEGDLLG